MQRALCIKILIVVAVLTIPDYRFPTALFAQLTTSSTEILSANLFDDTILVKYKETVLATNDPVQRERKITELSARLHSQYGMTPITTLRIFGIQRLRLGPGQTIDSAIAALVRDPAVEYAERNYRVVPLATPQTPPPTEMEWTSGLLWGLVKIGMKNAWGFSTGGAVDIVVAVIDSGIDNTNFDLAQNMWIDPAIPGSHGASTCGGTANPMNSMDTDEHGTLVAGVIGAKGSDPYPAVGIYWNVKLMALKFMCSYDAMGHLYGAASDAIHAIEYAMSKGAAIINNSWRLLPSVTADGIQHPTVDEINNLTVAIQMTNCQPMYPNCKPALFVAAAGNALPGESKNNDLVNGKVYPASINVSNVIVVAATNQTDALWVDSHYGPTTVHIAAPGVNIDSTSLGNQNNGISATSGTSMAAPHVAGCAALLQARSSAISSSLLSVTDLKNKILNNADPIVGLMVIGGRRLNCAQAMSSVPSYGDTTPPASPTGLTLR